MPQCSATCKDGGACHHKAKPGQTVCGKHTTQGQRIPTKTIYVVRCGKRMTNGAKCTNPRQKGCTLCTRHHKAELRRQRRGLFRELWFEALDLLWGGPGNIEQFTTFVMQRVDALTPTEAERLEFTHRVEHEVDFYFTIHPAIGRGRNPPRTELEGLARDNQNVHTGAVSKQTQEGLTALLETPVPTDQDTLAEVQSAWLTRGPALRKSILRDMSRWYTQETCRTEGDYLYQRLLDGLWTRIKLSKHKDDLVQRLWEEATESLKMCCEGHISRLCNVLVGYDETFKTPLSTGERLQQAMAAIAGEDISDPHKVVKAWNVMEELGIPRDERMAWIEAF